MMKRAKNIKGCSGTETEDGLPFIQHYKSLCRGEKGERKKMERGRKGEKNEKIGRAHV